jgi:hypothetical protein
MNIIPEGRRRIDHAAWQSAWDGLRHIHIRRYHSVRKWLVAVFCVRVLEETLYCATRNKK